VANKRVPGFPVFATVARERGAIVERWWQDYSAYLGLGIPAFALVVAMAVFASSRAREAEQASAAARFHAVFDASPIGMAVVEPHTRRLTAVNGTLARLVGVSEGDLVASGVGLQLLFGTVSSGPIGSEIEAARRRGASGPIELDLLSAERRRVPVRVSLSALPGEPSRIVMTIQDITELRESDARRQLMLREVEHRAKNTLALVQAAVRMGASGTSDAQELARAVEARVAALGRSQSVLTTVGAEGAELRQLIEQEVLPFAPHVSSPGERRLVLDGTATRVTAPAAQALTMTFHELATNAAKYGAFSSTEGNVRISWHIDAQRGALVLDWSETNGPPIEARRPRPGFGTRLISTTIQHQLGGKVAWRWGADALTVEAELPLQHVLSGSDASLVR
jgi:two-component sensor histidine kinase